MHGRKPGKAVPTDDRALEILRLRREGSTLSEIGSQFNITRERVRQIIKLHGGPSTNESREVARSKRKKNVDRLASNVENKIRAFLETNGPTDAKTISRETGIHREAILTFWPEDLMHLKLIENTWSDATWTTDSTVEAIQTASIYKFPLTAKAYGELIEIGEVIGPSIPRINQIFGTWTLACAAAGVECGQAPQRVYQSRWSDEDILQFVKKYLTDPNQKKSFQNYDLWRKEFAPDGPSSATIRNRFGTWTNAKRAAFTFSQTEESK